jgi:hypothetical protein
MKLKRNYLQLSSIKNDLVLFFLTPLRLTMDSKTEIVPVFKTDKNWSINQRKPTENCFATLTSFGFPQHQTGFIKNWTGFIDFVNPAPDTP